MPKFEKEKEDELPKANIPTISLDSGKYNKNVTIKIESSNENEYIIYTVIKDDNNPSGGGGYGSVLYSLNGEEGKTITYLIDAYVMGNGTTKKDSDHVTRTYTISLAKSNNNSNSNNSSSNSSSSSNTQSVTRTEANTPCEEWHNSKNWTWSEKTKTCVYRVTNTSSK